MRIWKLLIQCCCIAVLVLLAGCEQYLAFGTATTFGVEFTRRPDQPVDIVTGYRRYEMAAIPVPPYQDADETTDSYGVMGTFDVQYDDPFNQTGAPLIIHQVFATGQAARNVAEDPTLSRYFGKKAGIITRKNVLQEMMEEVE